jgi:uncharacterized lipoprotein YajG
LAHGLAERVKKFGTAARAKGLWCANLFQENIMRGVSLIVASALLAVSACASLTGDRTAVVSASPQNATIRFPEGSLQAATSRAQELCATHQRSAQLRTVTPGQGNERIGSFDCV